MDSTAHALIEAISWKNLCNVAQNGFDPKQEISKEPNKQKESLVRSARSLFARVPILGALCSEVLISQCATSLVSFLFLLKGKELIVNDADRARWTGNVSSRLSFFDGYILSFLSHVCFISVMQQSTDSARLCSFWCYLF
jgi:hypothetical protein